MTTKNIVSPMLAILALGVSSLIAADPGFPDQNLPKPDGKPADMSKPVKVFIMMGQSNMVGMAPISGGKGTSLEQAVKTDKMYPFMLNDAGDWSERQDVRYVRVMVGKGTPFQLFNNEWLKPSKGTMGVEYGAGHKLGNALQEPVMLLKSCIGNRGLCWDLLPPGAKGYDFVAKDKTGKEVTYTYAGYKESPNRWEKGTTPTPIGWYAGKQYDDDVANAKAVLNEFDKYYPGAKGYEVAGFFWWQGEKDAGDAAYAEHYEDNLVALIKALRKDFNAPNAKFVIGTMGEAAKGAAPSNTTKIMEAHLAVDGDSGKHPEFKGSVATVYTNPVARGGSGNGHYGGDSRVYMDVGLMMGDAMVKLLKNK